MILSFFFLDEIKCSGLDYEKKGQLIIIKFQIDLKLKIFLLTITNHTLKSIVNYKINIIPGKI